MKTPTAPEGTAGQQPSNDSKILRILKFLRTGQTLNRFDAEALGDHCLNSTISTLRNRHGLGIAGKPEKVKTRWGAMTGVIRYSLPVSEHERADWALKIIGMRCGP